jgi:hypothetical protein
MNFRIFISSIALATLGAVLTPNAVPAAELAVAPMHHRATYARTGYVLWDDVYPPAIYGP